MTHSFKEGDIVRVKKNDQVCTLEDVNPRALTPEYSDEYWALGSGEGGYNNIELYSPDEIELVMSAKEAANRQVPTASDIVAGLDLMGSGFDSVVDVHTSEVDGNSVWCYGKADNGLDVVFKVTVTEVFEGGDY